MAEFTMRAPDDMHLHLRSGEMLRAVLPYTARQFKRAVIMPNVTWLDRNCTSILNRGEMETYRDEILDASRSTPDFEPLMTIQITESTIPKTVFNAREAGGIAGKIYPRGMTTNSENGVNNYEMIFPALDAMQECGMLALFHGESPDLNLFCLDREVEFLQIIAMVANVFPKLKIVLEHVTTARAVEFIKAMPANVAATITVHHLFLTLNDVIGGKLEPHHFCKPVAKRPEDRRALIEAAMSGNPKFFLGTDSAPHLKDAKECTSGCAGVYTAPIAIPLLLQLFEQRGATDKLEDFCSGFGADFYSLPRNQSEITLVDEPWKVPLILDGVVPFHAGKEIGWQVK